MAEHHIQDPITHFGAEVTAFPVIAHAGIDIEEEVALDRGKRWIDEAMLTNALITSSPPTSKKCAGEDAHSMISSDAYEDISTATV